MRARTLALVAVVVGVILLAFAFCSPFGDNDDDDRGQTTVVQTEEADDDPAGGAVAPAVPERDVSDCDAGDRRRNEVPDCGFRHKGRFVPYGWVTAGKTTAPYGWNRAAEIAAATRPAGTRPSSVAKPTSPAAQPTPRQTTATRRVPASRPTTRRR